MVDITIRHGDDTLKAKGETIAEAIGNLKFEEDFRTYLKLKMYITLKSGDKVVEDVIYPKELKLALQKEPDKRNLISSLKRFEYKLKLL